MRQPDYKTANRQMGFVPGMKPPRTTQQNTAPMGLGQPAGQPGPAQPAAPMPPQPGPMAQMGGMPPGPPPMDGMPPPPGPMGPPPPPPGPSRADLERQLWASRNSRNPVAVLADAYQRVLGQAPDYDTIDELLQQRGIDDSLRLLLGQNPQSLLRGTTDLPVGYMRRAVLGR